MLHFYLPQQHFLFTIWQINNGEFCCSLLNRHNFIQRYSKLQWKVCSSFYVYVLEKETRHFTNMTVLLNLSVNESLLEISWNSFSTEIRKSPTGLPFNFADWLSIVGASLNYGGWRPVDETTRFWICCTMPLSVNNTKSALSQSGSIDIFETSMQETACRNRSFIRFLL